MSLKHPQKLFAKIAEGLKELEKREHDPKLSSIEVAFVCPDGSKYKFGLTEALDNIANDIFWNADGNWSEAQEAEVYTI
jgi:hypothetical protein